LKTFYRISGLLTVLLLLLAVGLSVMGYGAHCGPIVIAFFVSLAVNLSTYPRWRGFVYTVSIFAAVAAAMYYPAFFSEAVGFDLKKLIVPLLMVIMFGMGTSMSLKDFAGVFKMPKGVLIGLLCQFTIMPVIGLGLAILSGLPKEVAAGILLVGCSPSGLASNVMAYISGANLALSLTLTAVATLLAPVVTPFLMKILAGELVPIDFWAMQWSIVKIVIIPIVAGLLFNRLARNRFAWLHQWMPKVSMAGIAIIITIITAAGRDSLLDIGLILIGVVIVHNISGFVLGYWISRGLGMDERSARTIAIEVGMQNSGLASGLALEMGRVATTGLAPSVFGPFMNISGSALATYWQSKQVKAE
jgi:BASS family bile acid:Na+ symporter